MSVLKVRPEGDWADIFYAARGVPRGGEKNSILVKTSSANSDVSWKIPFIIEGPVWTNPRPTASFAAQTINVDLSGYDFWGMIVRYSTTTPTTYPLQMFTVDDESKAVIITAKTSNYVGGRHATYSTQSKTMTFNAAYYNASSNNSYVIPQKIYGIRGLELA